MPSSSFLSRISRLPLLGVALALATACAGRTPISVAAETSRSAEAAPVVQEPLAPAPSVFDIKDLWYSQHVDAARLSSLSGGLLVVGFVDSNCEASCATTLASMRTIERETDAGTHFVLVTRTAANSTPAELAAFAKAKHLNASRYTVISASPEAIAKLASALDTRRAGVSANELESSSMLSVLDFNGILVQQRGYGVVGPIIEALTLLSNIR